MNERILVIAAVIALAGCEERDSKFCGLHPDDPRCGAPPDTNPACSSNAECTAPTAVCDLAGGTCVECTVEQDDACGGMTPVCSANACAACTDHVQCGADSLACLPDGACGDGTVGGNVAYVDPAAGTDNAKCDLGAPCATVAAALATGKPFVKLTGTIDEAVTVEAGRVVTILADPETKLTRTTPGAILTVRDDDTSLTIYDLAIADAPNSASGIGIVVPTASGAPTIALHRVTLSNNPGGGIATSGGSLAISQSTIFDNDGGGIAASGGSLTVSRSTISGNQGGGISVSGTGTTFDITNSFIFRNGDPDLGRFGGVALDIAVAGTSRFEFNTVVDNRAASGATRVGGVLCDIAGFQAGNNIVARNTVGGNTMDLTSQTLGVCVFPSSKVQSDLEDLSFVSPDVAPFDYRIEAGSTAIDQATTVSAIDLDQEGDPRPQGAQKDIGADELSR